MFCGEEKYGMFLLSFQSQVLVQHNVFFSCVLMVWTEYWTNLLLRFRILYNSRVCRGCILLKQVWSSWVQVRWCTLLMGKRVHMCNQDDHLDIFHDYVIFETRFMKCR